jgi:hypothetical protein
MPRTLLATLIVSALVLNTWSATAATRTVPTGAVGTVGAASNRSALPPGRAAGIKEAQGIESDSYWRQAAWVIGAFVLVGILMGIDDSDEATTTTHR